MLKQLTNLITVSVVFCLFGAAPAYAPPKPKAAGDLNCATPCVQEGEIENEAISTDKLAPNSVTGDKIAGGTVTESDLNFDPATQAEFDALPKVLVIRDGGGNLVGRFMGLIGSESGPALVMYQGNPADADFFGAFPLVTVQLEPDKFVATGAVNFQNPDCDETGEIYISEPRKVFDLPLIKVINDPVIGAVAYVPTIPVTPVGNAFWSSRLEQSGVCTNTSSNGGRTLGQPGIELGFFPPYGLSD